MHEKQENTQQLTVFKGVQQTTDPHSPVCWQELVLIRFQPTSVENMPPSRRRAMSRLWRPAD